MKNNDQFIAASIGDVEWLKQCIKKGSIKVDKNGLTALHLAAMNVHLDCIKLLIEKCDFNVNLTAPNDCTPLQLAINKKLGKRSLDCVKYLLEKGANPSLSNCEGTTALHQAASQGYLTVIKMLIEWGAQLDCKDNNGYLPLDCAQLCGEEKCYRVIGSAMWNQNKDYIAAQVNQLKKIKYKLLHFKNRKLSESHVKESKSKKGTSWQPDDVSDKTKWKSKRKQADQSSLRKKKDAFSKTIQMWNPFSRCPPDKYIQNLPDEYPRDPYTMMPISKAENKYFDGKHKCERTCTCSPALLSTDELYHFQLPDLPADQIAKELAADSTLFERPIVFKCKTILDVCRKGKSWNLSNNEVGLHISSDTSSFVFQNSLQPNTKMLIQTRKNSTKHNIKT